MSRPPLQPWDPPACILNPPVARSCCVPVVFFLLLQTHRAGFPIGGWITGGRSEGSIFQRAFPPRRSRGAQSEKLRTRLHRFVERLRGSRRSPATRIGSARAARTATEHHHRARLSPQLPLNSGATTPSAISSPTVLGSLRRSVLSFPAGLIFIQAAAQRSVPIQRPGIAFC